VLPVSQSHEYRCRGKPSPAPLTSIALGNSGDLYVELLAQAARNWDGKDPVREMTL
jgi:hypothetical protein